VALRRVAVLVACSLLVLTVEARAAAASPAGHGRPVPRAVRAELDAIVATVRQMGVPGVAVAVNGPCVGSYVSTSGTRDGRRALNPQTKFRIGSITKTFTATVILQLVDRGLLSLDDTVDRWQPKLQHADQITIRMLLNMTSGIFDEGGQGSLLSELVAQDPGRVWAPQEIIDLAIRQGPVAAPPSPFYYSDTNYVLLGMIAQAVTGMPIGVLIERQILRPLHLTGTSYPSTATIPPPAAIGYVVEPDERVLVSAVYDPSMFAGAGAVISTLKDLQVWARALATGALLSPQMRAEQRQFNATGGAFGPLAGFGSESLPLSYGLGLVNAGGYLGHNGIVPGFTAEMWFDPATGTTIVVLMNALVFNDVPALVDVAGQVFVSIANVLAST
jgi:D-alanyl-D-alanine carboxypeptidase